MSRTELAVVVIIVILIGSFLSIGVSRARIAAQKMSSQNNLKQIGLAVHNFESTYKKIPSGCDENANHGWLTSIFPYMEASAWYSNVDFDIAWEHPLNHHQFSISIPSYCLPGHAERFTQEGYGITDYQANPALMHKGSKVKFNELSSGLSNIWLAGEISSDQKPFGYPFNWRELNQPINSGPGSFGAWADGANFVLADGSIKFMPNNIDTLALQQFSASAPLPDKSLYESPERKFSLTTKQRSNSICFSDREEKTRSKGGPGFSQVWLDDDNSPKFIDFASGLIEVEKVVRKYPQAKTLRIPYPGSSQELELICSLKELGTLSLMSQAEYSNKSQRTQIEVNELLEGLTKLPRLKYLKLKASDEDLRLIKERLPNCEVVLSSNAGP